MATTRRPVWFDVARLVLVEIYDYENFMHFVSASEFSKELKSHIDSLVKTSKLVEKHVLFIKKMQWIKEKVKPNIWLKLQ